MKQDNFIPNREDNPFDSDDDGSSIHGDMVNANDDISGEETFAESENDDDLNDSNFSDKDTDSEEDKSEDASEDENDASVDDTKKSEASRPHDDTDDDDDDDDDAQSTTSEEATATMTEIFGTTPNPEANRNHPPNIKTDSSTFDMCFHPECELLAAGTINGDCVIYRYNLEKVEEVTRFSLHKESCRKVCYNDKGTVLYTVSQDKSLCVLDTQNSAVKLHLKDAHEASIYSFYEINENICATGDDDGTVKLWDLRKQKPILDFKCGEETVTSLLACEANKYLTATIGDGSITAFNLQKNRVERQSETHDSEFTCQALVRDDTRLVIGSGSGMLHIFNWGNFEYKVDSLRGHPDQVDCIVPISENMIITGCEDGNIRAVHLYDHRFVGVVGQHKKYGVENLALSCDGNFLASCSMDDKIRFWNIEYLYNRRINAKKKGNKTFSVDTNLESSRKRNRREFFNDIPRKMESDDEGGPIPSTSYDSD